MLDNNWENAYGDLGDPGNILSPQQDTGYTGELTL